jgi:uncharacterized protein YbaP (TraB family)
MAMIGAYKAHDLPLLIELSNKSEFGESSGELEQELLVKRNIAWIPSIEKAARSKGTFFAFGAAHLAGKQGVLTLLREKGYTVKPIQ